MTAEGLYRRALGLDSTFPDAQEAMTKIQLLIQVSWAQHTHLTYPLTWPRENTPHLPSHLGQRTHTSPDPESTHLTYPLTWARE